MTATREARGFSLVVAALSAPVVAVDPDARGVLHAATMAAIVRGWNLGAVESACGTGGLKLMDYGSSGPVPWPPRVASLLVTMTRCRACHAATGRKRPRSAFVPAPSVSGADNGDNQ